MAQTIEERRASQRTEEYKIKKRIRDKRYREKKNPNLKPIEKISSEEAKRRRLERKRKQKKRKLELNKKWITDYKKDKSCVMCGYNKHPEILHFHHTKQNKQYNISRNKDKSINTLKKEIEKCILLCPNCHGSLHYLVRQITKFK